jgi:hypothetical protein
VGVVVARVARRERSSLQHLPSPGASHTVRPAPEGTRFRVGSPAGRPRAGSSRQTSSATNAGTGGDADPPPRPDLCSVGIPAGPPSPGGRVDTSIGPGGLLGEFCAASQPPSVRVDLWSRSTAAGPCGPSRWRRPWHGPPDLGTAARLPSTRSLYLPAIRTATARELWGIFSANTKCYAARRNAGALG